MHASCYANAVELPCVANASGPGVFVIVKCLLY